MLVEWWVLHRAFPIVGAQPAGVRPVHQSGTGGGWMPVSSKTLNGYLALFRQTTSAVPIRVTHAARVRYLRDPWQQSVTGRYPPGARRREENKPMTTGRLPRRLRVDGEPRARRARHVPRPGRHPVTA